MNSSRLPITIQNHTNYFIPGKDRTHITVSNPNSWRFTLSKRQGYEHRLYWEYRLTQRRGGQTFFYTLTYNNKALPHDPWIGRPCFDYEHLRDLFEGAFRKQLLRKYGSTFKYFVGSELGEGAGTRGMSNNPHYHILLFVVPAFNIKYPYQAITPEEMTHLLKVYWQGFDEDPKVDGWHDYRSSKYGIVKAGKYGALVTDKGNACFYCAKYCTKDAAIRTSEFKIRKKLIKEFSKRYDDKDKVNELVNDQIRIFRNRYSNKVRISHGVGWSESYSKEIIPNPMCPYVNMPGDDDWDPQPIGLFYYRKLYTYVRKDDLGNNVYVLNSLGLAYRKHNLKRQLSKLEQSTRTNLSVLSQKVYEDMLYSEANEEEAGTNVTMSYNSFVRQLNYFGLDTIVKRYAQFKLVYEHRWFKTDGQRFSSSYRYPDINVFDDFGVFISPSLGKTAYDPFRVYNFVHSDHEGYSPYHSHPYFCLYRQLFRVLDCLDTYFFLKADELAQEKAEEIREINKFHNHLELVEYYKSFNAC